MGKNKLKKFREMEDIPFVVQCPFASLAAEGFSMKGHWHTEFFHNDNPIVLELGCGKGEYTVGLAERTPDKNFIGIDVKGARMWTGAKRAQQMGLTNVGFLRTDIELIDRFFGPGEVSEIWITFPDPQMKKVNKRLTGTRFMEMYRRILAPDGIVHLKTDSPFLYAYTTMMADHNGLESITRTDNLYASLPADDPILNIRTHYEQQWLDRGLTIKYFSFRPGNGAPLAEPPGAEDIPQDTYRSYSRGYIECPQLMDDDENEQ